MASINNKEMQSKIIDSFIFYNELEMLEFRLKELNNLVDKFILVESTKTFIGRDKPLFFEENKHKYAQYLNKIIHIIENDLHYENPWLNEAAQRNSINKGIKQLDLNDHDLIMISDVDEIPDINTIQKLKEKNIVKSIMTLKQDTYYYNITCKLNIIWSPDLARSKILDYGTYKNINSPQKIRMSNGNVIENGGWHFSYFGDINFIKNKIQNFSHQEYNNDEFVNSEHISNVIKEKKDLFKRDISIINPENNKYLPENYKMLLKFNSNE